MSYKINEVSVGEIKQGVVRTVSFTLSQDVSEIEKIESTCSCTTTRTVGNKMKVNYKPKKTAIQRLPIEKEIGVMYKDGSMELLVIKAIVIK